MKEVGDSNLIRSNNDSSSPHSLNSEVSNLILENLKLKDEICELRRQIDMILNICDYNSIIVNNDNTWLIQEFSGQDCFIDKVGCEFDDGEDRQTRLPCKPFTAE